MATGTDRLGGGPFPNGNLTVMLGPVSRIGDTDGYKAVAAFYIPFKCKLKRGWWFASEGKSAKTTTCNVKLVDNKDTPQTPVAIFDASALDDGAAHAMTIASHDPFLPGETLAMEWDFDNAADEIQGGCMQLELEPVHDRPKATEN